MTNEEFGRLHNDLGFAFSSYVTSHLDSPLLEHLSGETGIVFQTDDPDFNAYELQFASRGRQYDDIPDRPVTLIYVPIPKPPSVEGIDWGGAKVLARLVIKPDAVNV